ncbi:transposase family protein [Escherichia coli]|nr:transposase family protein [Escherichia coli]
MFAGKKSAQIREILINESAWEEMTCLFAPSLNNPKHDSYAISEKSHGREETRLHIVCDVPDELIDFTFE